MSEVDPVLPKYRTFWRRLGAMFIDGFVFIPLYLIEELILFGEVNLKTLDEYSLAGYTSPENIILIVVINAFVWFVYSIWMTAKFGQTVGKMATRIKILDEGDEASVIGIRRAFYRDAPLVIAQLIAILYMVLTLDVTEDSVAIKVLNFATGIWLLAELISMFQNVRRRAIHDYLAGSVVVKV